jgi:hypothetical protein
VKFFSAALAVVLLIVAPARAGETDWRSQLEPATPGKFPALPGVRMEFKFGWSNVLEAAKAEATIENRGDKYEARVRGGTEGLARALWPLDAQHSATLQAQPLRPIRIAQLERYRKRTVETQVRYDAKGLSRMRKTSDSKDPGKWKRLTFAPIYDVIGGVLFVRSQPLEVGDTIGLVCFPGDSPYVAEVHVEGRETVRCMGRNWPALRLSLEVRRLEVESKRPTKAVKYAKFRSGTIWVSDDDLRIPLRAEVNVMVGFVYGELTEFKRL